MSIEVSNLRVTKLRAYLMDIITELIGQYGEMNIADTMTNIENIGFYETFEKIIKQKNDSNDLPDIQGIQSITCLNCGTLNRANTNTAEFDIQIQIEYKE